MPNLPMPPNAPIPPPGADLAQRAGWAADTVLAAALEAVAFGVDPRAVEWAGIAAARQLGAAARITAGAERYRADATLEKAELVRLEVSGMLDGHPFRAARTTMVGYDTLPAQVALGSEVLRALSAACAGLRAGWPVAGAVQASERLPSMPRRLEVALFRAVLQPAGGRAHSSSLDPLSAGTFALGDVVVVAIRAAAQRPSGAGSDCIRLTDMLRVTSDEPEALTRLPRRLWL